MGVILTMPILIVGEKVRMWTTQMVRSISALGRQGPVPLMESLAWGLPTSEAGVEGLKESNVELEEQVLLHNRQCVH